MSHFQGLACLYASSSVFLFLSYSSSGWNITIANYIFVVLILMCVLSDTQLYFTRHITTLWSSLCVTSHFYQCLPTYLHSLLVFYSHTHADIIYCQQRVSEVLFVFTHTELHTHTKHKEYCPLSVTDPLWAPQTFWRRLSCQRFRVLVQPGSTTVRERSNPGAALRVMPLRNIAPLVSIYAIF